MGDCLDTRSLHITNQPLWAEVDVASLAAEAQRVTTTRTQGAGDRPARPRVRGQSILLGQRRDRFLAIALARSRPARRRRDTQDRAPGAVTTERSPYWLGLRVSVVIPTHNRKEKLLACLDALDASRFCSRNSR